jgi:hypothetical protein
MKMYLSISLTVLGIFAFTFIGCTSKQASFTGEVNGVAFEIDPIGISGEHDGYVLTISAGPTEPYTATISIFVFANEPGIYNVAEHTFTYNNHQHSKGGNEAWYIIAGKPDPANNSILYSTDRNNTGTVIITSFDKEDKKVSGTFEFRAVQTRPAGPSVVNLKGSFEDVTYKQK